MSNSRWICDTGQRSGRLQVDGGLTVAQLGRVKSELLQAFAVADRVEVALVLGGEIDVAGLQLLCAAHRYAATHGKVLLLTGVGEQFRKVLQAAGFVRGSHCPEGRLTECLWAGMT